jgi:DNA-damage-inducible protein J
MAASNSLVRARIQEDLKADADRLLSEMGLSMSDYIRMSLSLLIKEQTLPFRLTPNSETRDAMIEARGMMADRKRRAYSSADALFDELDGGNDKAKVG